jgi:hypothetical protein
MFVSDGGDLTVFLFILRSGYNDKLSFANVYIVITMTRSWIENFGNMCTIK